MNTVLRKGVFSLYVWFFFNYSDGILECSRSFVYLFICVFIHSFNYIFIAESATSSSLVTEDWGINMEICDLVNSSEEGCVLVCYLLALETTDWLFLVEKNL